MTESAKSKGTVAIIGSGPAGLSAAYALRKGGYSVTIFEQVGNFRRNITGLKEQS